MAALTRALVLGSIALCNAVLRAEPLPTPPDASAVVNVVPSQWGLLATLAGKSWGFGNEGFATYQWIRPGETLIGTVRTFAGTYQTVYVLRPDGTIAGLRKLTETGESVTATVTTSIDRFSVTDAGLRYSCVLKRGSLSCGDEVSGDGKRWAVRSFLSAIEINARQLAAAVAAIPSGFPDWKPGTFDSRLGAFEKLAMKVWVVTGVAKDHEFRFFTTKDNRTGAIEVHVGDFDNLGNPARYYGMFSDGLGPLKSVLDLSIDPKHTAWNVEPQPGPLSSDGTSIILVDGNIWRFLISPDQHFFMLEIYNGNRQREDKIALRQIYRALVVPANEERRWRSVSRLFNNYYRGQDFQISWRWLAPGTVLVTRYPEVYNDDRYRMSYCVIALTIGQEVSGPLSCDGGSNYGPNRSFVLSDVTDEGFTWNGVSYRAQRVSDGWRFNGPKPDQYLSTNNWIDLASSKTESERKQAKQEINEARRAREHQQQADMQALYNSVSLIANRAMANAGMNSTTFDQARTDWSSSGTPAPLRYDAGGVYGQATADGGYYVSSGVSSKEVEAFQARERGSGDTQLARNLAQHQANYDQRHAEYAAADVNSAAQADEQRQRQTGEDRVADQGRRDEERQLQLKKEQAATAERARLVAQAKAGADAARARATAIQNGVVVMVNPGTGGCFAVSNVHDLESRARAQAQEEGGNGWQRYYGANRPGFGAIFGVKPKDRDTQFFLKDGYRTLAEAIRAAQADANAYAGANDASSYICGQWQTKGNV